MDVGKVGKRQIEDDPQTGCMGSKNGQCGEQSE